MNGKDIKDNPYLCTRAIEEGHLVLPLSKSGNSDILYADKTTFMDEVEVKSLPGVGTTVIMKKTIEPDKEESTLE